jgi:hypothetical protein
MRAQAHGITWHSEKDVNVLNVQKANGGMPRVEYRWDTDTDILTADIQHLAQDGDGMTGSVELAGNDGSWLILDVKKGRIEGIEVAVWPDVRKVNVLAQPSAEDAAVEVLARRDRQIDVVQVDTPLAAEADQSERTIHFSLGSVRAARTIRIASDVLLELDDATAISGIWLLNVPPFPADD